MSTERVAVDTASAWPDDAEDVDEGVVVTWFAREGTHVERDETLCEIQIEKVSVDVQTPETGTLAEIVLTENDEFEHGDTLAWILPE